MSRIKGKLKRVFRVSHLQFHISSSAMSMCRRLIVNVIRRDNIGDQHRAEQRLCSDGGQRHLAASVNKKQKVFFSDTDLK